MCWPLPTTCLTILVCSSCPPSTLPGLARPHWFPWSSAALLTLCRMFTVHVPPRFSVNLQDWHNPCQDRYC
ncbi:hypothetical protein PF005_g16025 [Phytophthora fragariae]|uniref:Secreted protein n=1 Tax=Phytophthora fragariae TaxID=53985 RepID=A0A6A3QEK0_9STRA|nr:hypothetical protein PF003_g25412 [Phytophthora fragariae]KAE8940895.1 hypothetical protein PF009_g9303 [Phytophthora fragariae]KAE9016583.1 hypothetical protein PF011_g7085 [Phytophthora fragariae]KAE9074011.1 hypothetical protein PF007_g25582 [Phytophthora fragariae]KAE9109352.1 hypothetical protein PF010_g11568 [Phytophthora fragariae]